VLITSRCDVLTGLERNSALFEPEQLRERLEALDALDAEFGDLDPATRREDSQERTYQRVRTIRARLEAANAEVCSSIRAEIMGGAPRRGMRRWMRASAVEDEKRPKAGPAFDWRDELLSGTLQLREPGEARLQPAREMVFYQPTPVRHILSLITASALSADDVIVDLGSGLGHVPLFASMLTGARSVGIEVEAAYVTSAQECARSLNQSRIHFIHEDARTADLSGGTVFYLYSPFTGSILTDVLGRLRKESASRRIRICTFGPCTYAVAKESWLKASTPLDTEQITVFEPSLCRHFAQSASERWISEIVTL
jgi:hypothetical protein